MIDFGITPHEFRARYLEQRPRLVKAALHTVPFAWADLDAVLHRIDPAPPAFELFKRGLLAVDEYSDRVIELGVPRRRINKRRFFEHLRNGATLVMNRFEDHAAAAMRLCGEVGRYAGWPTTSNAYLSVGGRGTFGRHWDTHDVFALQLLGRKTWHVYPPTFPLPLPVHRSDFSGEPCPPTAELQCTLEPGDLLYVPRGWWHEAVPLAEPSLHLSIGAYAPTVNDYLMWACARHLPAVHGARRAFTDAATPSELDGVLEELRRVVLDPARRAEFCRETATRERRVTEFDTELYLGEGAQDRWRDVTVRLNLAEPPAPEQAEIVVKGAQLRLHALSRSIVATVAAAPLPIDALCERLPNERPDAIRAAVLDLAQHEIVAIERSAVAR